MDEKELINNIITTINRLSDYLNQAYELGLWVNIREHGNGFHCSVRRVEKLVDLSTLNITCRG